jgi:hypothetical protein
MRTDSERTSKLTNVCRWSYPGRKWQASEADKSRVTDYGPAVRFAELIASRWERIVCVH